MNYRVILPLTKHAQATRYFESDSEFPRGQIVVVDFNGSEEYGIILSRTSPRKEPCNKVLRAVNQLDKVLFWIDYENKLLKKGLILTNYAYNTYKTTKNNQDISKDLAEKKILRNLLLAHKPDRVFLTGKSGKLISFQYGFMRIVCSVGVVYEVHNNCKLPFVWKKDMDKYNYFSKVLGVEGI